ncbi:MAG: CIA30 family protein [Myxococcota bacterium]|nr:CIA30 family protein [Myxococcota bacterium]
MIFLLSMIALAQPILYQELSWRTIHDNVMGGVSSGTIRQTKNRLVFEGFLSLENNGGFASARARVETSLSKQIQTLRIRVIGDGRTYFATLRTDENPMIYYRQEFITERGFETEIELPMTQFQPHAYGRFLPQVPPIALQSYPIESIGFMLADKKQGDFSLQILSIDFNGEIPLAPTVELPQKRALIKAIQSGVPFYNQGRADLCASTYREALMTIQNQTPSRWFDILLSKTEQDHDRQAWWYRHMIDHLLDSDSN